METILNPVIVTFNILTTSTVHNLQLFFRIYSGTIYTGIEWNAKKP